MKTAMVPADIDLLKQAAEEDLRLLYDFHSGIRTIDYEQPTSMEPLLRTWLNLHKNHHQLQKILNRIIYEITNLQPGRIKKTPEKP